VTVLPPTPTPHATVTITTTATPTTPLPTGPAAAASSVGLGGWLGVVLSATVIAALITGSINLWLARIKARDEERARVRNTFAEAFQAYADYKEMPYAVRRRDPDKAADERRRLSEELRAIQSRLSYYESWISIEAPAVGEQYAAMVGKLRAVAGGAMRDAWNSTGTDSDASMNIPPSVVDLSALSTYESAYRAAVSTHLAATQRRRKNRH
jgi:hypothetical protein